MPDFAGIPLEIVAISVEFVLADRLHPLQDAPHECRAFVRREIERAALFEVFEQLLESGKTSSGCVRHAVSRDVTSARRYGACFPPMRMTANNNRDIVSRAAEVVRRAAQLRTQVLRDRRRRGLQIRAWPPTMPAAPYCESCLKLLRQALTLLQQTSRDADLEAGRARLIDRATIACANARLFRHQDLRADLQAMLTDTMGMPLEGGSDDRLLALRRLIRSALYTKVEETGAGGGNRTRKGARPGGF